MLLNVYVPIYDSVLVVIAAVLTLGAVKELKWATAMRWIMGLSMLVFIVSWVSNDFAQAHRVQLLPVAFAALGSAQLFLLYRVTVRGKMDKEQQSLQSNAVTAKGSQCAG
jgi:ABC-type transport system involved in cytochrome bd biosynthesis fused ATPase/permease subunit